MTRFSRQASRRFAEESKGRRTRQRREVLTAILEQDGPGLTAARKVIATRSRLVVQDLDWLTEEKIIEPLPTNDGIRRYALCDTIGLHPHSSVNAVAIRRSSKMLASPRSHYHRTTRSHESLRSLAAPAQNANRPKRSNGSDRPLTHPLYIDTLCTAHEDLPMHAIGQRPSIVLFGTLTG